MTNLLNKKAENKKAENKKAENKKAENKKAENKKAVSNKKKEKIENKKASPNKKNKSENKKAVSNKANKPENTLKDRNCENIIFMDNLQNNFLCSTGFKSIKKNINIDNNINMKADDRHIEINKYKKELLKYWKRMMMSILYFLLLVKLNLII